MNYLTEAFQRLSLLEDDFDVTDDDERAELAAYVQDDVEVEDEVEETPIIDVEAESENDLADNYIGKVILECECCHSRIYKNEDEVLVDEETSLANIEEACPICNNTLGYTVIGKIEPFDAEADFEEGEEVELEEPTEKFEDELEDEAQPDVPDDIEEEEEPEEVEESLKEELRLTIGFGEYTPWSGAVPVYEEIVNAVGEDALESALEDILGDTVSETEVNDYIWFNGDDLKEYLGINFEVEEGLKADDRKDCVEESCEKKLNEEITVASLLDELGITESLEEDSNIEFHSKAEAKEYWDEEHLSDPVLADYSSFEDWFKDSVENGYALDESLKEDINIESPVDVEVGEDGKVTIDTADNTPEVSDEEFELNNDELEVSESGDEMIAPLDDEEQNEILDSEEDEELPEEEVEEFPEEGEELSDEEIEEPSDEEVEGEEDFDIDDFNEEDFDNMGESFTRKVYENVKSFKTTGVKDDGVNLVVEGLITFDSDKKATTSFTFSNGCITKRGKVVFEGYNPTFSKSKKAFKLTGTLKEGKLSLEKMAYNFSAKALNENNQPERVAIKGVVRAKRK